jgi:hypothetical protein
MIEPPRIVRTAAQPTAVIHITIPREEIRKVMGPGHQELMAAVAAQGLWECYAAGPESNPDPASWRTELNRPLARPAQAHG